MPRKVNIPLAFGRSDRADPKFAPFGTLRTAKNLRVRKDGRLASRTAYVALNMLSSSGSTTMVAYDLHEFTSGRLCAAGASSGEGFPVDIYEYRGEPVTAPWRPASGSQGTGVFRPGLTPFTAPRAVCGTPQPARGVQNIDCASGGGYVATIYQTVGGTTTCYAQIVRESDDQVIASAQLDFVSARRGRVCYSVDRFYFAVHDGTNLRLLSFLPGSSGGAFNSLVTIASSGNDIFEIEAVGHASTSPVIVVYAADVGTITVSAKRYNSAGTQQGTTLAITSVTAPQNLAIEADEVANTVNVVINNGTSRAIVLRTFNFANTLLTGPTTLVSGNRPGICRLPARTGWLESIAVVSTDATDPFITVQWIVIASHVLTASQVLSNAYQLTSVIPASTEGQPSGVVFGGYVEPADDTDSTNALWYVSTTMIHMATRDLRGSAQEARSFFIPLGLSLDTSTGRLAWASLFFSGIAIEAPTITTLALNSTARRQSASAGGLLYLAGGPVQVYDGHALTEAGFNEVPRIVSVTAATSGSLANNATYDYVLVIEYALPDGTFYQGPPSPASTLATGASDDEGVLTISGPHTARVALGSVLYGAEPTAVIYRTTWDALNLSQGTTFHEVKRAGCPSTLSDYGDDIVIHDTLSDATASENPVLYTQGGPVENNAPDMATYISASSARVSVAGLARTSEFQESKEQQLDQAVNWSVLSSFSTRSPQPINGILSLDGTRILFSRPDIYTVTGDGPDDAAAGALPPPVSLGSPSGLRDWRSLLLGPDGVWFQLDDAKLYRMPRGGGSPEWLGVEVQDTLALFPVITGAARCRQDDTIVFAAENAASSSAKIIVRSLRTGVWLEDDPQLETSQGIEAICSYGDRVAYVSGGVVYAQQATSFAEGASSIIVCQWRTEPIYPFEMGGNGWIHDVQATGEFRSAGTLAMRVSYDDGVSFAAYDSFVLTGTAGDTVKRRWSLQRSDIQSVVFELTYTPSVAGEGLILNQLTLLVDAVQALEDLDPSEQA